MQRPLVSRPGRIRTAAVGVALAVGLVAAGLVAGCSAFTADTQRTYNPGQGQRADSGDLRLRNAVLVTEGDGSATLLATVFNRGRDDDQLAAIVVDGGEAVFEPIELPAGGVTVLGADTEQGAAQYVTLLSDELTELNPGGNSLPLQFVFNEAGPVELDLLVVPRTGPYADVPAPESVDDLDDEELAGIYEGEDGDGDG